MMEKKTFLLQDSAYQMILKAPTKNIEFSMGLLFKKSRLSGNAQLAIKPQTVRPPRLYSLPQTHKNGTPLTPIVSSENLAPP